MLSSTSKHTFEICYSVSLPENGNPDCADIEVMNLLNEPVYVSDEIRAVILNHTDLPEYGDTLDQLDLEAVKLNGRWYIDGTDVTDMLEELDLFEMEGVER